MYCLSIFFFCFTNEFACIQFVFNSVWLSLSFSWAAKCTGASLLKDGVFSSQHIRLTSASYINWLQYNFKPFLYLRTTQPGCTCQTKYKRRKLSREMRSLFLRAWVRSSRKLNLVEKCNEPLEVRSVFFRTAPSYIVTLAY